MIISDYRIRVSIHLIIPIDYKRHYNIITFTNKTI